MANDLAVREPSGTLAIQDGQTSWDPMQLAALAQLGIKDAPDGDKQVFLHVSQRTGLDPFARQIYMIGRNEKKREQVNGRWEDVYTTKWTIQTGIEGWRVIRDRAERRYGVRGIKSRFTYYAPDGSAYPVWVRREPPVAVEMTYTVVEPDGREVPYTSVLRFDEYKQTKTIKQDGQDVTVAVAQWATKPVHMLEKCTEADAYRCAFPQDFSGVVLDDAMPSVRPEDMSDEELDATARAVGWRPRVTGDQARERAQQQRQQEPQRVPGEVVRTSPADGAGWPEGATAERPADPTTSGASSSADAPASGSPARTGRQSPNSPGGSATGADGDPRDAVLRELARLKVTSATGIADTLTQLAGHPVASAESLTGVQAAWFAERLAKVPDRDALDTHLAAGTVPDA